jgi:alpha-beta hydrolase superfamily lysophospholipase
MNARRSEAYKTFESAVPLGFPSLTITYRNDEGLAPSSDRNYGYGRSEWPDLEAAVLYARANGASSVILAGYSMGASIVMSFMEHSAQASDVSGLILDAPLLSLEKVIDFQASRRHLPGLLTDLTRQVTTWRYGVDWDAVEYRDTAVALDIPVLLFHGANDDRVPVAMSDAFARARPDIVTYVRVATATHARSWNVDTTSYESAVTAFLQRVAP